MKSIIKYLSGLMLMFVILVVSGCGQGNHAITNSNDNNDGNLFTVKINVSKDNNGLVTRNPTIDLEFSNPVKSFDSTDLTLATADDAPIDSVNMISDAQSDNKHYTFSLKNPLKSQTKYVITVNNNIVDELGNKITGDLKYEFTTGDLISPTIDESYPKKDSIIGEVNPSFELKFSKSMDINSIIKEGNIKLINTDAKLNTNTDVSITDVTSVDGETFTFKPKNDLERGANYSIIVTTNVKDTKGNPVSSDHVISFKVANHNEWVTIGETFDVNGIIFNSSIVFYKGQPYIAYDIYDYDEEIYKVVVKTFEHDKWIDVGDSGAIRNAHASKLAINNGKLYLAYTDIDRSKNSSKAKVRTFDDKSNKWIIVGENDLSLEEEIVQGIKSIIFNPEGVPYVLYTSGYGSDKTYLKMLKDNVWTTVGDSSIFNFTYNHAIAFNETGKLYLAYITTNGNKDSNRITLSVILETLENNHWKKVGNFVPVAIPHKNVGDDYADIGLTIESIKNNLYVNYKQDRFDLVKIFNEETNTWTDVVNNVKSLYYLAKLQFNHAGTPYFIYADSDDRGRVKVIKHENDRWVSIGDNMSLYTLNIIQEVNIMFDDEDQPYISYIENYDQQDYDYDRKVVVKKFIE